MKNRLIVVLLNLLASGVVVPGQVADTQASRNNAMIETLSRQPDSEIEERPADKSGLFLKPTRKIEFTTDEGTWISLDVTPDGRFIIFDLLGDLYRVPVEGGDATRITEGIAYDSQPRVSPDGRWLAFMSDAGGAQNLWVARVDGSEPREISHWTDRRQRQRNNTLSPRPPHSPAWTWDSSYLMVSGPDSNVHLFHIDGGSGVALTEGGQHKSAAVASPGDNHLYFSQNGIRGWQIVRLDRQTGAVEKITQRHGSAFSPLISPDGRLLAYAINNADKTQAGLRVRNLETGADRSLVYPVHQVRRTFGGAAAESHFPGYSFMPDGEELVVAYEGKIHRVNLKTGKSRLVPFTVNVALEIGSPIKFPYRVNQGPVRPKIVQDPEQSLDGKRLVFSVLTKLYVMTLSNGEPKRLTSGELNEFKPDWSPDGHWIAYVTWSRTGGHIWKVRSDGSGKPQRLTRHPAFYTDVAFSPDGRRIVGRMGSEYMRHKYNSPELGSFMIPLELFWLPSSGDEIQRVPNTQGMKAPHFTDNSERVYAQASSSEDYHRSKLVSFRLDGGDRRTHLVVEGLNSYHDFHDQIMQMSPDGKWALLRICDQLYVTPIPVVGAAGLIIDVDAPGVPLTRITDIGVDYFSWADGGNTIAWAIGSVYYRRTLASIEFGLSAKKDRKPLDSHEAVESIPVDLTFQRARPQGTIALRHVTAITMNGQEVISDADIVVKGNRIVAVGSSGHVSIPADARELDLSGRYVIPGFIDTHAHWRYRGLNVLQPENWSFAANLAYGVTAGLDVNTNQLESFVYQDLVETGQSIGPRAFMTGPGVVRHGKEFRTYEATFHYLKRYKKHYRTHNIKSYEPGDRQHRQWMANAARELQLNATSHPKLTNVIDGFSGFEHWIFTYPIYKDIVELFARTGTSYTPTLLQLNADYFRATENLSIDPKANRFIPRDFTTRFEVQYAEQEAHVYGQRAAQAAKIQQAGGLVGVGSHGYPQGLSYHWEMWALGNGMSAWQVLQAATIDGAGIIGVAQDLGSITEGKLADLVILDENPLENIRNTGTIRYVMKNGELYEGDTLKQVWPVEEETLPMWH